MRQTHYRRRAAHVFFHEAHRSARLEIKAAGVEANAFSYQSYCWVAFLPPIKFQQPRLLIRCPANGMYQRKAVAKQLIALDNRNLGTEPAGKTRKFCLQLVRPHFRRGRIYQISNHKFGRPLYFRGAQHRFRPVRQALPSRQQFF